MSNEHQQDYHLTNEHKYVIKYMLCNGHTPKEIVNEWDVEYHHRAHPSIQTIYSTKRKIDNNESVETMDKGPKKRSVLNEEKLVEIEKVINDDSRLTNESLSAKVQLPPSTTRNAKKILGIRKFNAIKVQELTVAQKVMRKTFCETFLKCNHQYQMRIWWSDESTFKVEDLMKYQQNIYYSKENKFQKKKKITRKKL